MHSIATGRESRTQPAEYTLFGNTTGDSNTANGAFALFNNTSGILNTATGVNALSSNNTGSYNTASGGNALYSNTTGEENTANGFYALFYNTTGSGNIAIGTYALFFNTTGDLNTAIGGGSSNTAVGAYALRSSNGDGNTAMGSGALIGILSGSLNTALGLNAGQGLHGVESNNIDIGANVDGVAGESNTIRIGNTDITDTFISGISGTTVASGAAVLVDSNGHLGTVTSSKRFKDNIKPMDKASEVLLALKPVTFRYKKEIDPAGISQFGLVAEEVEKVNPDLVVRDQEGTPYTVRYEAVNAMLLNEFLKEQRKVQEQQATITELKKDFGATVGQLTARLDQQASQIQKVSARLEASKPAPQVVNNP